MKYSQLIRFVIIIMGIVVVYDVRIKTLLSCTHQATVVCVCFGLATTTTRNLQHGENLINFSELVSFSVFIAKAPSSHLTRINLWMRYALRPLRYFFIIFIPLPHITHKCEFDMWSSYCGQNGLCTLRCAV